jgi:hypothetical protein
MTASEQADKAGRQRSQLRLASPTPVRHKTSMTAKVQMASFSPSWSSMSQSVGAAAAFDGHRRESVRIPGDPYARSQNSPLDVCVHQC